MAYNYTSLKRSHVNILVPGTNPTKIWYWPTNENRERGEAVHVNANSRVASTSSSKNVGGTSTCKEQVKERVSN